MLTNKQIDAAKAKEKAFKLKDEKGLYLFVTPTGSKLWRMKYRWPASRDGKEKLLSFGQYPDVSLATARDRAAAAKKLIKAGEDPALEKKREKMAKQIDAAQTFQAEAIIWHGVNVLRALERDVFPFVGSLPLKEIDAPILLECLKRIEGRGALETAHRVRQNVEAVFAYAMAHGRALENPACIVAPALEPVPQAENMPAITELEPFRQVIRDVECSANASPVTKLANRLLALTAVRPGTLAETSWAPSEFRGLDGPEPIWEIPAARMKLRLWQKELGDTFNHLVPLSKQAVEVIEAIRLLTGTSTYLFPNERDILRPMSENCINRALKRVGYHERHVPHGHRSAFSTIMNEKTERAIKAVHGEAGSAIAALDEKIIDLMLAHMPKSKKKVQKAYDRARYLQRRREIAQDWADMLLEGFPPAMALLRAS
jgi:integrase